MASIRKRNGKFQAQIRRAGYKTISRTFAKKRDALEWARETELKADRRGMPQNLKVIEQTKLYDLLKKYTEEVIPKKKSAKNETVILKAFMRNKMCHKSLAEITGDDFEIYKTERLKRVKGSTVNREFNIIRHAYNTAITVWEMPLTKNPLDSITKAPTPKARQNRLTKEQEQSLLQHAAKLKNKHIYSVIVFALETGMRRSEILKSTYEDVSLDKRTLHIPDTKTGHARTIPLSSKALQLIKGRRKKGMIFPVKIKAFEYHWQNLCKKAKLVDYHFHDLRHEAISRFFERGLSVPEVALISGHRDYRMLARYTHLKAEDLVEKL